MRIFNVQQIARPTPSDRNQSTIVLGGQLSGTAPHTSTTRATYTVPVNRKAVVDSSYVYERVNTVAGTPSLRNCRAQKTNIVPTTGFINQVSIWTNIANDMKENTGAHQVWLIAGESASLQTQDQSTGGTMDYTYFLSATEFDV